MERSDQPPTWTLGDRLSKARRWAGLSRPEMATATGYSIRTISAYENDMGPRPKRSVVVAYHLRTGVPLWWLEGFDGPPTPDGVRTGSFSTLLLPRLTLARAA